MEVFQKFFNKNCEFHTGEKRSEVYKSYYADKFSKLDLTGNVIDNPKNRSLAIIYCMMIDEYLFLKEFISYRNSKKPNYKVLSSQFRKSLIATQKYYADKSIEDLYKNEKPVAMFFLSFIKNTVEMLRDDLKNMLIELEDVVLRNMFETKLVESQLVKSKLSEVSLTWNEIRSTFSELDRYLKEFESCKIGKYPLIRVLTNQQIEIMKPKTDITIFHKVLMVAYKNLLKELLYLFKVVCLHDRTKNGSAAKEDIKKIKNQMQGLIVVPGLEIENLDNVKSSLTLLIEKVHLFFATKLNMDMLNLKSDLTFTKQQLGFDDEILGLYNKYIKDKFGWTREDWLFELPNLISNNRDAYEKIQNQLALSDTISGTQYATQFDKLINDQFKDLNTKAENVVVTDVKSLIALFQNLKNNPFPDYNEKKFKWLKQYDEKVKDIFKEDDNTFRSPNTGSGLYTALKLLHTKLTEEQKKLLDVVVKYVLRWESPSQPRAKFKYYKTFEAVQDDKDLFNMIVSNPRNKIVVFNYGNYNFKTPLSSPRPSTYYYGYLKEEIREGKLEFKFTDPISEGNPKTTPSGFPNANRGYVMDLYDMKDKKILFVQCPMSQSPHEIQKIVLPSFDLSLHNTEYDNDYLTNGLIREVNNAVEKISKSMSEWFGKFTQFGTLYYDLAASVSKQISNDIFLKRDRLSLKLTDMIYYPFDNFKMDNNKCNDPEAVKYIQNARNSFILLSVSLFGFIFKNLEIVDQKKKNLLSDYMKNDLSTEIQNNPDLFINLVKAYNSINKKTKKGVQISNDKLEFFSNTSQPKKTQVKTYGDFFEIFAESIIIAENKLGTEIQKGKNTKNNQKRVVVNLLFNKQRIEEIRDILLACVSYDKVFNCMLPNVVKESVLAQNSAVEKSKYYTSILEHLSKIKFDEGGLKQLPSLRFGSILQIGVRTDELKKNNAITFSPNYSNLSAILDQILINLTYNDIKNKPVSLEKTRKYWKTMILEQFFINQCNAEIIAMLQQKSKTIRWPELETAKVSNFISKEDLHPQKYDSFSRIKNGTYIGISCEINRLLNGTKACGLLTNDTNYVWISNSIAENSVLLESGERLLGI